MALLFLFLFIFWRRKVRGDAFVFYLEKKKNKEEGKNLRTTKQKEEPLVDQGAQPFDIIIYNCCCGYEVKEKKGERNGKKRTWTRMKTKIQEMMGMITSLHKQATKMTLNPRLSKE